MIKNYNYIEYNNIIKKFLKNNENELVNSLAVFSPINKNYFLTNKKFFIGKEKFFFINIILSLFKLIFKFSIFIISKKKTKTFKKKKILFLSHSDSVNKKKINDPYFGRLIKNFNIHPSKYLIKFYPQTNKLIINNDNFFNGNNLNIIDEIKIIKKVIKVFFCQSYKIFSLKDNFSKKIILDQLSGNTYKNYRIALEIINFVKANKIEKLFITFEGHSYEKLICFYLKKYLPKIKIYGYQTTCMSKYQSFLYKEKISFLPHRIFLSRKSDLDFFNSHNKSKFKPIFLGKLNKVKKKIDKWKLSRFKKNLKILILIDRYNIKDLNQILKFSKKLGSNQNFKIVFRPHPLFIKFFYNKFEQNNLNLQKNFSIDNSPSFYNLFYKNDILIFSQSSLFLESYQFGIFPIYFKYNSQNYEDIFKSINKPVLNSPDKFNYLIKNFNKIEKKYNFKNYLYSQKDFLINKNKQIKKTFS